MKFQTMIFISAIVLAVLCGSSGAPAETSSLKSGADANCTGSRLPTIIETTFLISTITCYMLLLLLYLCLFTRKFTAFGHAFDEIVVESTLNVKRKADGRQSRNSQAPSKRTKRQNQFPNFNYPGFGASSAAADAQAQSFDVKNALGNFGASASGGQSQSLTFGPNGPLSTASFAGAQQYRLPNGQTFDVSFGNAVGSTAGSSQAGGAAIALSGPRG